MRCRTAGAAVLLAGWLGLVPVPALAHGGPIAIDVHGDGGHGVVAVVTYARDKHPVSVPVTMTFTARDLQGRTVGPVRLVRSTEGQGFYVAERPLPSGTWTVTVQATTPQRATATARVTSADPVVGTPSPRGTLSAQAGGRRKSGGWPWPAVTGVVVAGLAVLAGALLAASAARRRAG